MKKIFDFEVLDVLPVPQGLVYVKKELMDNGAVRAGFFGYDAASGKIVPIKKWAYFQQKFGAAYAEIIAQIKDYISCDATVLSNKSTALLYRETGELGIFSPNGRSVFEGELKYNEAAVRGAVADGRNFWSVVPSLNAIVCYSPDDKRVQMRIGGGKSTAFDNPISLSRVENKLYVCNSGSNKVRTITLDTYSVSDFLEFEEPVYRYYVSDSAEFVELESGFYVL